MPPSPPRWLLSTVTIENFCPQYSIEPKYLNYTFSIKVPPEFMLLQHVQWRSSPRNSIQQGLQYVVTAASWLGAAMATTTNTSCYSDWMIRITCVVGSSMQIICPKTHSCMNEWRGVSGTAKRHIRTSDRAMFTMNTFVGVCIALLRATT